MLRKFACHINVMQADEEVLLDVRFVFFTFFVWSDVAGVEGSFSSGAL